MLLRPGDGRYCSLRIGRRIPKGGVATMSGVIVGVLIMGMVSNVLNLLNVPTFYQYLARVLFCWRPFSWTN